MSSSAFGRSRRRWWHLNLALPVVHSPSKSWMAVLHPAAIWITTVLVFTITETTDGAGLIVTSAVAIKHQVFFAAPSHSSDGASRLGTTKGGNPPRTREP